MDAGYVGVLLRGDTAGLAMQSKEHVQGMMNGYVFIAYSSGSSTEFRIYRSTDNYNTLDMLILTHVNLDRIGAACMVQGKCIEILKSN